MGARLPGVKYAPAEELTVEDEPELAEAEQPPASPASSGKRDVRKMMDDVMTDINEMSATSPALAGVPVTTPRRSPSPRRPVTPPMHYESPPKWSPSPEAKGSASPRRPSKSPRSSKSPKSQRASPGAVERAAQEQYQQLMQSPPKSPQLVTEAAKQAIEQALREHYQQAAELPPGGKIVTEIISTTSVEEKTPEAVDPLAVLHRTPSPRLPSPMTPASGVHGWRTPDRLERKAPTPPSPYVIPQVIPGSEYLPEEEVPEVYEHFSPPQPHSPYQFEDDGTPEDVYIVESIEAVQEVISPIHDILQAHDISEEFRHPDRPAAQKHIFSGGKMRPLHRRSTPPAVPPIMEDLEDLPPSPEPFTPVEPFRLRRTPPKAPAKERPPAPLPQEEMRFIEHYIPTERQEFVMQMTRELMDVQDDEIPYFVPPALPHVSPELQEHLRATTPSPPKYRSPTPSPKERYSGSPDARQFEILEEDFRRRTSPLIPHGAIASPRTSTPYNVPLEQIAKQQYQHLFSSDGGQIVTEIVSTTSIQETPVPSVDPNYLGSPHSPMSFNDAIIDDVGYEGVPEYFETLSPHEPHPPEDLGIEIAPEEFYELPPPSPPRSPEEPPVDYIDLIGNIHTYALFAPSLQYLSAGRPSKKPGLSPVREIPQGYDEEYIPFRQAVAQASRNIERRPMRVGKRQLERHSAKPGLKTWEEESGYVTSPKGRKATPLPEAPGSREQRRQMRKVIRKQMTRKKLDFLEGSPDGGPAQPGVFEPRPLSPPPPEPYSDLPDLSMPDDLLGEVAPGFYQKVVTELETATPEGLPSPIRMPISIPGWRTPEKYKDTPSPQPVSPFELRYHPEASRSITTLSPPTDVYSPEDTLRFYTPLAADMTSRVDETIYYTPHLSPSPPSPSQHKPSPFLTPQTPQYTPTRRPQSPRDIIAAGAGGRLPTLDMNYPVDLVPAGSPPSPMSESGAMRGMLEIVTSGQFRAERKPVVLHGYGERPPKYLDRWTKRSDLPLVREDQDEPPDTRQYWPGPYRAPERQQAVQPAVSPRARQPSPTARQPSPLARQPSPPARSPSPPRRTPSPPTGLSGRQLERIESQLIDIQVEISPRTPKREPVTFELESPELSPRLRAPQAGARLQQEYLSPQALGSPQSPRTPVTPIGQTSPDLSMIHDMAVMEALGLTAADLPPSPRRSPLPRTPPPAPEYMPYEAMEGPGSPSYSPRQIRRQVEQHQFTEHRHDRNKQLMRGGHVGKKSIPVTRRRGPPMVPIVEAPTEGYPGSPARPRREVREEELIQITPPTASELMQAQLYEIRNIADAQYAALQGSPSEIDQKQAELLQEIKDVIDEISLSEFESAIPIMDRAGPVDSSLPAGMMDPGLEWHSPPRQSPPRATSPRLPYPSRLPQPMPYSSPPTFYGSPEGFVSPDLPSDQTGESAYYTAVDMTVASPEDIYGGSPEFYPSPTEDVPSPFLGYTPPPRSPIESPSFIRRIMLHKITEGFLDPDRPSAQKSVRSGKKAVKLHGKAPVPPLEGLSEYTERPVITPPHLHPAVYATQAPRSAERHPREPELPSPVRYERYRASEVPTTPEQREITPTRRSGGRRLPPKERKPTRRKLLFEFETSGGPSPPRVADEDDIDISQLKPLHLSPRTSPRRSSPRTPEGFVVLEESESVIVVEPGPMSPPFTSEVGLPFGGRTSPGLDDGSPIGNTEIEEGMDDFKWMG